MPSTKVKAVVIRGVNVKEKDKLITLFTLEKGKMVASMKGVRGEKAKLKSAKEIFSFGEFVIEEGKNSNIVTAVDIIDNFYNITSDIDRYYEGNLLLDIVDKIVKEENSQLFIELLKALKTLCYDNVKKYYVAIKFLLSIFKAMGYGFLREKCTSCNSTLGSKYFNFQVGEIVCPACRNAFCVPVSEPAFSAMKILDRTEYEKLSTVSLGGMGEVQAFNILSKNFEFRTGYKLIEIL